MSKTEAALQALTGRIAAVAGLPVPMRNEILPTKYPVFGAVGAFLNVLDGEGRISAQILAEPDGLIPAYEIRHEAQVEWIVEAADRAARDAAFDAGLVAIDDALIADRTLGGTVDYAAIEGTDRSHLFFEGGIGAKAVLITIALTFTSPRPF